jgi:hypothetical protein
MPIQRDSSASPVRAALFFSAYAAIFTLLLTGSRQATLLIASAVTLATFAVWPHSAAQPLHAAVLIALLTNPIAAIVPTLLTEMAPRPHTPLVYLQIHANTTAEVFAHGCSLFIVLFPIICHYWLTTPAPPPRL